jgi:hypothetical protein
LWGDPAKIVSDYELGLCSLLFEDFAGWSAHTVNTNANIQGSAATWKVSASANVTLNPPATIAIEEGEYGVLTAAGATTDNDELYLGLPYGMCQIDTAYPQGKILLEMRVKRDVLTDATGSFSLGLAKVADLVAAGLTDGSGVIEANWDHISFNNLTADADKVNFTFGATGQAYVTLLANAATLVADTWIKLGFLYHYADPVSCIRMYVDGVQVGIANTVTQAIAAGATFPNDVVLTPFFAFIQNGTADTNYPSIDWAACAQYFG